MSSGLRSLASAASRPWSPGLATWARGWATTTATTSPWSRCSSKKTNLWKSRSLFFHQLIFCITFFNRSRRIKQVLFLFRKPLFFILSKFCALSRNWSGLNESFEESKSLNNGGASDDAKMRHSNWRSILRLSGDIDCLRRRSTDIFYLTFTDQATERK